MKELTATVFCVECNAELARIYGIDRGQGIKENITEPENMTGIRICPTHGSNLVITRPESGPLPEPVVIPDPVVPDPVAP